MFAQVLLQCEQNINSMPCCHDDGRVCNCYNCLYAGFRNIPDTYNCEKKNNYYVLKYGSSYISEIYHYLENSHILESLERDTINILSLGCGFCPDYYAISEYITNKGLAIHLQYDGLDKSMEWNTTRVPHANATYTQADILNPFSLQNAHIVMLNKIFSTVYRNGAANKFLSNLENAIKTSMQQNSILVFNDINSCHMGRDVFEKSISPLFSVANTKKYYTDTPPYTEDTWIKIPEDSLVVPVTALPFIEPINIRNNVFFEYRK